MLLLLLLSIVWAIEPRPLLVLFAYGHGHLTAREISYYAEPHTRTVPVVACSLDATGPCFEDMADDVTQVRVAQFAKKYSRVYVYTDNLLSIFEEGVLVKSIASYTSMAHYEAMRPSYTDNHPHA